MIGYVSPFKPELKYREMALYNAAYCSVCKAIKKMGGRPFCFGLSHDLTSFLFLQSSLMVDDGVYKMESCIWNPFKKVNILANYQDEIRYTAALNILLFYYKAKDNSADDRNAVSLFIQALLWPQYHKIRKRYAKLDESINKALCDYNRNEKKEDTSLEMMIDPYAVLIGNLVSDTSRDPFNRRCLYWLGYHTAKSTCIIDAIDDFDKDLKSGSANILHPKKARKRKPQKYEEITINSKAIAIETVLPLLHYSLHQMKISIRALPILRNQVIIDNIFIDGIGDSVSKVLNTGRSEKNDTL